MQATVTNMQVAVKYRQNVSSLSVEMSADDRTTNISVDCRSTYRPMLNRYVSAQNLHDPTGLGTDLTSQYIFIIFRNE